VNTFDIIRAWKDPGYRNNLSGDELAMLPANPAGSIELTDDLLESVAGGKEEEAATQLCSHPNMTSGCCQSIYNSCYVTCSTPGTCLSWCIACSY
jgi:mersacidin/lichenicidin family type 2 lantibiotic